MKKLTLIVITVLCSVQSTAIKAWVGCAGKVRAVELRNEGYVIADWGFGQRAICNMKYDFYGQLHEACPAIYSQFLTALTTGKRFTTYHGNSNSCSVALAPDQHGWPAEPAYGYEVAD